MLRIARVVRAIKQQQLAGEKTPLTPYVGSVRSQNSLQLSWTVTEQQRKLAERDETAVTSLLQICDPQTLEWSNVYRGSECKCTVDDLAPSSLYLFRLKVFEAGREAASKWSETVSGLTRDEPPSVAMLHRAIEFANHQEVQKILQIIPIAACSCFSDAGLTCLQTAVASGGDLKMLKLLLQHGDVNEKSCGIQRTALMMACAAGKVDVVKMLLENGARLEITDRNGLTALHHSVGHGSVVKLILDAGALVDAVDCCGWTPLMRAVLLAAEPQVMQHLIAQGASVHHRDQDGLSCLAAAVIEGDRRAVALLCAAGADSNAPADAQKNSALEIAAFDAELVAILSPVVSSITCPPVVKVRVDSQEEKEE